MKAIILNSGTGSRMEKFTENNHKSMVEIKEGLPLLHYQLNTIEKLGIRDIIITTGHKDDILKEYTSRCFNNLNIEFVHNEKYLSTNYIYSLDLIKSDIDEDIILLHGDLYFEENILKEMIDSIDSSVVVDTTLPLPEKDFKAQILSSKVSKIGTYLNDENCVACQPLYKLNNKDWNTWKKKIREFCGNGQVNVYAEEALNTVLDEVNIIPYDAKGKLCMEVDTLEDLEVLKLKLKLKLNKGE